MNYAYCNKNFRLCIICIPYFPLFFFFLFCITSISADTSRSGTVQSDENWNKAQSPIIVKEDLEIPENFTVTIEPGVEIRIQDDVVITVFGRLDALGSMEEPIHFLPAGDERWGAIVFEKDGTGILKHCYIDRGSFASGGRIGVVNAYKTSAPVIIENCTFTRWPDDFDAKAVHGHDTNHMVVRHCRFGEGENEAVHGVNSPILVEYNTFERRFGYSDAVDIGTTQNPGPIIRYNVFLGSDDDGIDLDDCDAYVEGNLVMNCRGGNHDPIGISGDKTSKPIIVNNVVIDCETGIGFKNGAQITCYNNTIVNCDKGFWMHQEPAHAKVYNTIIWGRDDQLSIKLESGSTIDIAYSIIRGDDVYPGEGNLNQYPMFADPLNQVFRLFAGSPAIDAGWGGEGVKEHDFLGLPRVGKVDIGAYEYQQEGTGVKGWIWNQ